jgi:hypothetical protein
VQETIRDRLKDVPGVAALALGGSRARGNASPDSDWDIGLYYDEPPDFDRLLAALGEVDGFGRIGEWGPWINGGVWARIDGVKVDVLLRDVNRVREVVVACAEGRPEIHYQVGHPHGFCTAIYAGEVHENIPFHDPHGTLADLKALTDPYPEPLARALTDMFGWEAGFALDTARQAAGRGDVAYVAGSAFRAVACLTQVLFARNRRYLTNEKGAVRLAGAGFEARVNAALAHVADDLPAVLRDLDALRAEVTAFHRPLMEH